MRKSKENILKSISDTGVVAVIRAKSIDQLADIATALLAGGVTNIELTMTTPNALQGIEMLATRFGDRATIGVGTILDSDTCRKAIDAGAEFVISPALDPEIVATTNKLEKVSIPGAYSPTEILRAHNAGADIIKVFPSTGLGPQYFKDLLAPLPFLKLTPTGGVDIKNAAAWIKAGAVCVGVGSSLVSKESLEKSDWAVITSMAKAFVEAVRSARV